MVREGRKRCLLVEDERAAASLLRDVLRAIELQVECVGSHGEAKERVDESWDMVFVDLRLSPGNTPLFEGLDVIHTFRDHIPRCVIIAYSAQWEDGNDRYIREAEDCRLAGADAAILREELAKGGGQLRDKLLGWLAGREAARLTRRPLQVADDIHTGAAIESISGDVLGALIESTIDGGASDRVNAIPAGHSGAMVFKVETTALDAERPSRFHILKVSRNRGALEDELGARPPSGSSLARRGKPPLPRLSPEIDGWTAAAVEELRGWMSLSKYLSQGVLNRRGETTLRGVVQKLIIEPAGESISQVKRLDEYSITKRLGADVVRLLEEVAVWKHVVEREDRRRAEVLRGIVLQLADGTRTLVPQERHLAYLHGDLHCDNVFVAEGESPIVIDFGKARLLPRMYDAAALEMDWVTSRMDLGEGRQWDLGRLDKWERWAISVRPYGHPRRKKRPGTRLDYVRGELDARLYGALEGVSPVEQAEGLLFQALRYLRFPTVSMPRRLLLVRLGTRLSEMIWGG